MRKICVMVAGFPGKMATLAARAIAADPKLVLCQSALSEQNNILNLPGTGINLACVLPEVHEHEILAVRPDIIVDFTHPRSVNGNAELYCNCCIPFVMGTTGGNRENLVQTIQSSRICAVVARNMAAPVVAMMEMLKFAGQSFPGQFKGWKLVIQESHQAGKSDKSGTAIELLDAFKGMGVECSPENILSERNPSIQEIVWHVPQEFLGGHGFHKYMLSSPDGKVGLAWVHNVCGRDVYADGAIKAIKFLHHKLLGITPDELAGKVYNMVDVLKAGF